MKITHSKRSSSFTFSVLPLLASCTELASDPDTSAPWSTAFPGKADIYGEDSRREVNDPSLSDEVRALASSVAMVFSVYGILEQTSDEVIFPRTTMSDNFKREHGVPLCEEEPFAQQVAPGFCTAFLITPQLVATAGHCVNGHTRCEQMAFAFGYAKTSPDEDPIRVPIEDVYRCEELIGRLYNPYEEPEMISSGEFWYDWAVIKLDRPVTGRAPVKLMEGEPLKTGAPLRVLGHPSGLPMKLTEGDVISDTKERYFNTTLDIYQGNSGSPVFDAVDGDVQGIVIRGSGGNSFTIGPALRPKEGGGFEILAERCGRSLHCNRVGDPGCIGNHALRIDPVRVFAQDHLKIAERHTLIEGYEPTGFRQSFSFEGLTGEVDFATLHLNAGAHKSDRLRVLLHHGAKSVEMMRHPRALPYGRWTATKFDFKGADPNGEWVIEVIDDEGDANFSVEWAQVMLGYHAPTQSDVTSSGAVDADEGPISSDDDR